MQLTVFHLASQYFPCLSFLGTEIASVSPLPADFYLLALPHFFFLSLLLIFLFTSEQKDPTLCCPCNVIDMTLNWKLTRGTQRRIKRFLLSEKKCVICVEISMRSSNRWVNKKMSYSNL